MYVFGEKNGGGRQREGRVMGLGKKAHEGVKPCKPLIKMGKENSFTWGHRQ